MAFRPLSLTSHSNTTPTSNGCSSMHRRMPLCEMNDVFASQHLPHPLYIPLVSLKDLPAVSRASQQCFVAI